MGIEIIEIKDNDEIRGNQAQKRDETLTNGNEARAEIRTRVGGSTVP
jgi:hypothetical protein